MTDRDTTDVPPARRHSHSTLSKVFDELSAVAEVIETNGLSDVTYDELRTFTRQLEDELTSHVEYEEAQLFPGIRPELGDESAHHHDAAIDQHRMLERGVDELREMVDSLEPDRAQPTDSIREQVEHLRDLWQVHDRTEAAMLQAAAASTGTGPGSDTGPVPTDSGTPEFETVIVGGGIIGMSIGWRLAERGHEVLVLERNSAGCGASSAAAGMLAPAAEAEFGEEELYRLQKRSRELYPEFLQDVSERADRRVELHGEGSLLVARDRDESEALDRTLELQRQLGTRAERLTEGEVKEREPGLRSVHSALFLPDDRTVDNRRLVDALVSAFEGVGGELRERSPVDELWIEDGEARGVKLRSDLAPDRIAADRTVVAAGAWSGGFESVPELANSTLRPVRGEALALDAGDPPACEHALRCPDVYLVPRPDGELMIGATSEEMGFECAVTGRGLREPLQEAWTLLPAIDERVFLRAWAGLRPVSLDGAPLIGRSTRDGVWLATGHGRHGILLAPSTAELMATALEGGPAPDSRWPLVDPGRFL